MSYVNKKLHAFREAGALALHRKRSDGRMKTYPSAIDARAWCDSREDRRQHILDLIRQGDGKGLSLGKYIPIGVIIDILLAAKNETIKNLQQEIDELKKILRDHGIHHDEKPVAVVEPTRAPESIERAEAEAAKPTLEEKADIEQATAVIESPTAPVEPEEEFYAAQSDEERAAVARGEEDALAGRDDKEETAGAVATPEAREEGVTLDAIPEEEGPAALPDEERPASLAGEEAAAAPPAEQGVPSGEEHAESLAGEGETAEPGEEDQGAPQEAAVVKTAAMLSDDKGERGSKTSSHHSQLSERGSRGSPHKIIAAESVEKRPSKASSHGSRGSQTKKKGSGETISAMKMEIITVDGKKSVEERVTKYDEEAAPVAPTEMGDSLYKPLAIEAIQQLEIIKYIVYGKDMQAPSPANQPESSRRRSKESIKSGTGSRKSDKIATSGRASPSKEIRGSRKSKESIKSGEAGKRNSFSSAPVTNQQPQTSQEPEVTGDTGDAELRKRLDNLKGLEDAVKKLRDTVVKSLEAGGDTSEKDRLKAQIQDCELKLKELEILKVEKNCLKGRCKDLEEIQRAYEDLLRETQGFDTLKAQCAMYKSKYEEMLNVNEQNLELQEKVKRAAELEKERETLLKAVEDCESCISKQEEELKRLTSHIECLSDELDKRKEEGKTRTMRIVARLKKEDLMPISNTSTEEAPPCEADCLRARIQELENEVVMLKADENYKSELEGKSESLKQELDDKEAKCKALQEKFDAMESSYNELDSNYKALEANYKTLENTYATLGEENKALEKAYQEFEEKYKAVEEEYKELQNKYKQSTEDYHTLMSQFKASEANNAKLETDYKTLEIKYQAIEMSVKQLEENKRLLEENLKFLQDNNKTCLDHLESEKSNSQKLSDALRKAIKNDEHLKEMLKQTKCAIKCITLKLNKHEIVGQGQLEKQKNELCKKLQEFQGMTEVPCGAEKIVELEDELSKANATIKCLRDNLDQLKGVMDGNDTLGKLAVQLQDQQLKPFCPAFIK